MLNLWTWWHNEASPTLPGYVLVFLLSLACSRRVPALRPVAACFAAWSLLDAVTGPLWLRAGVLVAWPGAALAAGAWGLQIERDAPSDLGVRNGAHSHRVAIGANGEHGIGHLSDVERDHANENVVLLRVVHLGNRAAHARMIPHLIAILYLLAGCAAALPYAFGHRAPYHALLPLSRALAVTLCTLAAVLRPLPRTWAARACVAPAVGLACGVVAGVWTLLPAGMGAVREAWGRLAGTETWVTLAATIACVAMTWAEAYKSPRP